MTSESEIVTNQVTSSSSDDESRDNDAQAAKLLSKTKPYSNPVHNYFSFDKSSSVSSCKYCNFTIKGKFPTNLTNHLKSKHSTKFTELIQTKADRQKNEQPKRKKAAIANFPKIDDTFKRLKRQNEEIIKGSKTYDDIIESVANLFVSNSLPYCLIEKQTFLTMMRKTSGGKINELPSRFQQSGKIENLTKELRLNIQKKDTKFMSFTVDLWSRPNYSAAFVGVTCHFYDAVSVSLKTILLACRRISQPHTASNIHDIFVNVLAEWDIDKQKVYKIVTDNGSNIVKAFRYRIQLFMKLFKFSIKFFYSECLMKIPHIESSKVCETSPTLASYVGGDLNLEDSDCEDDTVDDELDEFLEREKDDDEKFSRVKRMSCFAHSLMLVVQTVNYSKCTFVLVIVLLDFDNIK